MVEALLAGGIAGYGIAIPVGPIAVLILEVGVRHGFGQAAAAGAGAASADGMYATLAAFFGTVVAAVLAPVIIPARFAGAALLGFLGIRSLLAARTPPDTAKTDDLAQPNRARTYASFLGLTVVNPMTFLYFSALVLGLPALSDDPAARLAFVIGAFAASLSWQLSLAFVGATLHGRMSNRARRWTQVIGGLIVLAYAAKIGLEAIQAGAV